TQLILCFVFFFQAEDGIRDKLVTGVQTCALPISRHADFDVDAYASRWWVEQPDRGPHGRPGVRLLGGRGPARAGRGRRHRLPTRSEERRVGKECRWRGAAGK